MRQTSLPAIASGGLRRRGWRLLPIKPLGRLWERRSSGRRPQPVAMALHRSDGRDGSGLFAVAGPLPSLLDSDERRPFDLPTLRGLSEWHLCGHRIAVDCKNAEAAEIVFLAFFWRYCLEPVVVGCVLQRLND